jgi:ABC-type transporter Mla subunit MlaD
MVYHSIEDIVMENEKNLADSIVTLTSQLSELCSNINMLIGNSAKVFSELRKITSGIDATAKNQAKILDELKKIQSQK